MAPRFLSIVAFVFALVVSPLARADRAGKETAYPAKVSENGHFLIDQHGKPFFYLGDTAWELFHRLSREEADIYLRDRASKGYTVIQAVVLAEHRFSDPTPNGHLPLHENDPTRPVEGYFKDVDAVVDRADSLGLVIGMLPTWGDKWNKKWGKGPEIFTPENAAVYGEFLGRRYRDKPVVWILGGDRPIENDRHAAIIRAMAGGLRKGDGGRHLISYHPSGGQTSAEWFHKDDWLAFNMLQSGHDYNRENHKKIAADYTRQPTKPCMDAEPGYEDHPAGFDKKNGYLDDHDVRKSAYWAIFAGAHGHTYGCHDIWQFYDRHREPITFARTTWREAMKLPGAGQMNHARRLIESRPFLSRIPDPSLITSDPGRGGDHVEATRDADGSYAFVYSASGKPFSVDLRKLSGTEVRGSWFDPRDGTSRAIDTFKREGVREFRPPSEGKGHDWILVLDDAGRGYDPPGGAARK